MRKAILLSVGVLLFAGGVGVGLLLHRGDAPAPPGQPIDQGGNAPNGGVAVAAKKRDKSAPSLDDDRKAICGLWRFTGVPVDGRQIVMCIWDEGVVVSAFDERNLFLPGFRGSPAFTLEELNGARVLLPQYHEERTVYFRYKLDGDRLEFNTSPAAAKTDVGENLDGVWQRLK